jgi:hypothetical protein
MLAGCSRTGLDVPHIETEDDLPADAASRVPDPAPSSSGGGEDSSSDAADDADDGGGQFFTTQTPDAARHGPRDGRDGGGCGPGTCAGCCTEDGVCQSGFSTAACGNSGQLCLECGPELSCNVQGICS